MAGQVGEKFPQTTLKTAYPEGPKDVTLPKDYPAPLVVLVFPLANTGVCEKELCSIRDEWGASLKGSGASVVAVSVDSPFAQKYWAEGMKFGIPLLSDFNKTMVKSLDAMHEDLIGLKGVGKRSAFVVDKGGTIRYRWVSDDPKQLPNFDEVKKAVAAAK